MVRSSRIRVLFFLFTFLILPVACQKSQKPQPAETAPVAVETKVDAQTQPPVIAPPVADKIPELAFEKFTLPNGLDVIFHTDKTLPMVHVNLWYHVGSKNDPQNIHGFAHLFEHMMFQGTTHMPYEFLDFAGEIGADDINASTSLDRTEYHMTVATEQLEKVLWAEADRMGFMAEYLDEKQFANQKDVVKNEKKERANDPYADIQDVYASYLFPKEHPYHWRTIGDMDELAKATLEDVKDFYAKYYTPNNATLTLAGNFDPVQAKAWIEKYFSSLKPGPEFKRTKTWVPRLDGPRDYVFEKDVPLELRLWVWPGLPLYDAEEAPLDFASLILSDGENSRLYKSLVHDEQLASDVFGSHACNEIAGYFSIGVMLRPGADAARVKAIVQDTIRQFANDGPTDEELQRIKAQREFDFVTELDSLEGKAQSLSQYNTYLGNPGFLPQDYQRYASVTAEQVRNAFQKWISNAPGITVAYLPRPANAASQEGLDRFVKPGLGTVETFVAPSVETAKLANGLEIYVANRPELPKVGVIAITKTNNLLEPENKLGTTSLMAAALDRGTETLPFLEFKKQIAAYGAEIGSGGGLTGTSIKMHVLKKNLAEAFRLFADTALKPRFEASEIEQLRKDRFDEIDYEKSKSSTQASLFFFKNLFGSGHPFALSDNGTKESVASITRDDIVAEYTQYWRPNNVRLIFVGDITLMEAKALAETYFSNWQPAEIPALPFKDPVLPAKSQIFVYDFPKAKQASVRFGFPGPRLPNPDAQALKIINSILGGGSSARLFKNLREDKGYTYGAYSGFPMTALSGYYAASAEVQTDKVAESLIEIKKELTQIATDTPPTAAEIATEKSNLISAHIQSFGTNQGVFEQIKFALKNGLSFEFFTSEIENLKKADADTIRGAIEKYFPDHGYTIVVTGNVAQMKPALDKIDWAEVHYFDRDGTPMP